MHDDLRRGYEILLGHPLESFPTNARYELWFAVDSELLPPAERVPALAIEQLVVGRPPAPAATHDREQAAFWLRYAVDYARTLFVYDKHDLDDASPELVAALQASHHALTGEELAALVERANLDLVEVLRLCWYACRRAVTDGSLLDAMAAATLSTAAPHWLMSRAQYDAMAAKIRFEPRWENALKPLADGGLREHLLMSCVDLQTARWAGSWIDPKRKADVWIEPVTRRGGEILAIWHSGEGQATRAVVKFEREAVPIATALARDESAAIIVPSEAVADGGDAVEAREPPQGAASVADVAPKRAARKQRAKPTPKRRG